MKNYKNLYKLLLIIPLAFIVSCDSNDDLQDVNTQTVTVKESTVFIETDDATLTTSLVGANVENNITVGLNNTLETDYAITFSVTKDGTTAVEGTDYEITNATILASELTGMGSITFLTDGLYEVTIAPTGSTVKVVENKLIFLVPTPLTFRITWEDDYYDYDLFLFDGYDEGMFDVYTNGIGDFSVFGYSGGFAADESFTVVPPVGYGYVYVEDYWNDNAGIAVEFTITDSEDEIIYSSSFEMDQDKWFISILTELDENNDVSYTIEKI